MLYQSFSAYIRDSAIFTVPLEWDGAAFTPGTEWGLIATYKRAITDADSAAVFQKASTAGIIHAGNFALIAVVPEDTAALTGEITLEFDVQARHTITGAVRTVARGKTLFKLDVTRETETSVPLYTTDPPYPNGITGNVESVNVVEGDELEIVIGSVTYYLPLYRRP